MLKYRLKCCLLGQYFLITVYQASLEIRSKIVLSFFAQINFFYRLTPLDNRPLRHGGRQRGHVDLGTGCRTSSRLGCFCR